MSAQELDSFRAFDECWIHKSGGFGYALADWLPHSRLKPEARIAQSKSIWRKCYKREPVDNIICFGAGSGDEAVAFASHTIPHLRVFAMDAHPKTYTCLKKTLNHNALDDVVAVNCAVA